MPDVAGRAGPGGAAGHLVDTLLGAEVHRAVERAFRASYERPGWIRRTGAGILTCGRWQPQ
ncbi:hypothetical protein [Nonomuraea sp. NPDC049625]|uniref:hypothetical protein n=1 Tax=Nonomuraea sp. NPDC049625 TaxID=3155775 RepID=UPI00344A1C96